MADFMPADVGRDIVFQGGVGTITGYTSASQVTVEIKSAFPATAIDAGTWVILGSPQATCTPTAATPVGALTTLGLSADGWRPEDVGKYVRINGGICKITALASPSSATARIEQVLSSVVAAPPLAWTLEGSAWGGVYGYPRCGTFYQQRHWLLGSPGFPQSLWASSIGSPLDFTLGSLDTDALFFDVGGGALDPIQHVETTPRGLVALTTGSEISLRAQPGKAITPTNPPEIAEQSNYGSSNVPPARVAQETFFAQRAGRKIRALSLNQYQEDTYVAPDMATLAEHVTESGVTSMAYQAEPDSILFATRADGQMAALTADRDQDVFAWSRQVTQGAYERVETVPVASGSRTFAVVARTIDGVTSRYIEMFEPGLHTDSALTGKSSVAATVWSGFSHLKNRTVQVKADGVYLGEFVVSNSGQITLTRPAFEIEAGLAYVTTVKTLTPEFMAGSGSAQGHQLSIHSAKVRLLKTTGASVNLQTVAFVELGLGMLDRPPPVFSGDKEIENLGWSSGTAQTLVQQTLPYDFHLLAVITKLTANEG